MGSEDSFDFQSLKLIKQEWMSSMPKHKVMYDAFGWKPPIYAHVGLLQDSHGQKLSKRAGNDDLGIGSYAESGVFPEALVNFVALLGWSHRSTVDFLRFKDLIQCVRTTL